MEQQRKIHGNKPRGKLDLNLENVTGNVITLEIAKREFMYGWDICKNPERYTWNKSTTMKVVGPVIITLSKTLDFVNLYYSDREAVWKKVLVSIGPSTFFANFQYFIAKKYEIQ